MVSATEIRTVAELLQISPEGLQKAITFKVMVSVWRDSAPSPRDGLVTTVAINLIHTNALCICN